MSTTTIETNKRLRSYFQLTFRLRAVSVTLHFSKSTTPISSLFERLFVRGKPAPLALLVSSNKAQLHTQHQQQQIV
jgi:hypothetical protein